MITSREELDAARSGFRKDLENYDKVVKICCGTGCVVVRRPGQYTRDSGAAVAKEGLSIEKGPRQKDGVSRALRKGTDSGLR